MPSAHLRASAGPPRWRTKSVAGEATATLWRNGPRHHRKLTREPATCEGQPRRVHTDWCDRQSLSKWPPPLSNSRRPPAPKHGGLGAPRLLLLSTPLGPRYRNATAAVVRGRYSFSAELRENVPLPHLGRSSRSAPLLQAVAGDARVVEEIVPGVDAGDRYRGTRRRTRRRSRAIASATYVRSRSSGPMAVGV